MTAPKEKAASPWRGQQAAQQTTISPNHSPIDRLLSLLEGVKRTGQDRWLARCPTRADKRPSMTIRELDDGRVLIHDFGGDSPAEILAALGLTFDALFPPRAIDHHVKGERRPFPAADILRALSFESLIVALAGRAILDGKHTEADQARLIQAVGRIQAGADAGGLNHG